MQIEISINDEQSQTCNKKNKFKFCKLQFCKNAILSSNIFALFYASWIMRYVYNLIRTICFRVVDFKKLFLKFFLTCYVHIIHPNSIIAANGSWQMILHKNNFNKVLQSCKIKILPTFFSKCSIHIRIHNFEYKYVGIHIFEKNIQIYMNFNIDWNLKFGQKSSNE